MALCPGLGDTVGITHSLGSDCSVVPSFLHHPQPGHLRGLLQPNCSVIPLFLHHPQPGLQLFCDSFIPSSLTAWSSLGSDHSVIPSLPLGCDAEFPSRELRISSSQRGLKCSKKWDWGSESFGVSPWLVEAAPALAAIYFCILCAA